eukprot:m.27721 g.27721  ORF g.27721 m.27721 type:complete len:342 (-) comp4445_c0_seq1:192-1217(-)
MLRNTMRPHEFSGAGASAVCTPCPAAGHADSHHVLTYTGNCTIPVDGGSRLRLHHFVYRLPDSEGGGDMEIPVLTSLSGLPHVPGVNVNDDDVDSGRSSLGTTGNGAAASTPSRQAGASSVTTRAHASGAAGQQHTDTDPDVNTTVPLVRVHDQCITSEVFGSLKCDCREQLQLALRRLASEPGAVIYMPQEGRGIGLGNKVRAYHLQESRGLDTVDANIALGLPAEARRYDPVPAILSYLGISTVRLMTNNPMKVESLRALGVDVAAREPCVVRPTPHSRAYFEAKSTRMRHILPELFSPSGGSARERAVGKDTDHIDSDAEKLVISTIPFDTSAMHSKL